MHQYADRVGLAGSSLARPNSPGTPVPAHCVWHPFAGCSNTSVKAELAQPAEKISSNSAAQIYADNTEDQTEFICRAMLVKLSVHRTDVWFRCLLRYKDNWHLHKCITSAYRQARQLHDKCGHVILCKKDRITCLI